MTSVTRETRNHTRVGNGSLTYCHAADESSASDAGFHDGDVGGKLILKDAGERGRAREGEPDDEKEDDEKEPAQRVKARKQPLEN